MARFTAKFLNKVDRKGRVSVPATFRSALIQDRVEMEAAATGRKPFQISTDDPIRDIAKTPLTVYLRLADNGMAIEGMTDSMLERYQAAIDALPFGDPKQAFMQHRYFTNTHQVEVDKDGRIILPRDLAARAGIEEEALFAGMANHFEIWEPKSFERYQQDLITRFQNTPLDVPPARGTAA